MKKNQGATSMRILMLTRYSRKGASSRLRSYQYVDIFREHGFEVDFNPLFDDAYLDALYDGKKTGSFFRTIQIFISRISVMLSSKSYDIIWIEKECLPFAPFLFERLASFRMPPYVVDYDDALFHRYDLNENVLIRTCLGNKIDQVMKRSLCVVAGNNYLAERARRAGAPRVEIVPTVVDVHRYKISSIVDHQPFRIGWIGTPVTSKYLHEIAPALSLAQEKLNAEIVLVGSGDVDLPGVTPTVLEWSEESEATSIATFTTGIMPLPNTPWERGKCGYKLIQYMALGKPVVASPVGANADIVTHGVNGYFASTQKEWFDAFEILSECSEERVKMGKASRKTVVHSYDVAKVAPKLISILNDACASQSESPTL